MKRRTLLKGTLSAGITGIAVGAGLLTPHALFAAWPKKAFGSKSVSGAIKGLMGSSSMKNSSAIKITAPPIAENGAEVGVTVAAKMPKVAGVVMAQASTA